MSNYWEAFRLSSTAFWVSNMSEWSPCRIVKCVHACCLSLIRQAVRLTYAMLEVGAGVIPARQRERAAMRGKDVVTWR